MYLVNKVLFGIFTFFENRRWQCTYATYRKKYNLPGSFKFGGNGNVIYGEGKFEAGINSYVNQVWIQLAEGYLVRIGKNSRLAHNIRIYTESVDADQNLDKDPWKADHAVKKGNVIIGDGVWIGANVFINPGVTIGDNAVVGANSVVSRDVEPFSIVGGVPAKFIRFKSIALNK